MNHRLLIQKLFNITQDSTLCRVILNLLSNRRVYAELNKERSRWRLHDNALPQGSVLSPTLFNIYTNDQPVHDLTRDKSRLGMVNLNEKPAKGYGSPWLTWPCLNRLRTGYTCSKEQRKKWSYFKGDTTCACEPDEENMAHMLQCSLLTHPCTLDDLRKFNDIGHKCTEQWKRKV